MATIVKKKQNKNLPFTVRWLDENHRQRETSFKTRAEAQAFMRGPEVTGNRGSETFESYATRWNERTASTKRFAVVRRYAYQLRNHVFPVIGSMPISEIRQEHIEELLYNSGLTPAVASDCRTIVATILNDAVNNEVVPRNVAKRVRVKYANKRAFVKPTYDQLLTIQREIQPEWQLVAWLMLGSGLRIGEALAINANDITDDGMLIVDEQVLQGYAPNEPILNQAALAK
jgi:integrase